ncbi:MAG: alkaline phosphatase family protein, partial [Gammaproteobacteria bacterium]
IRPFCVATAAAITTVIGTSFTPDGTAHSANTGELYTRNVILVTVDGLRWEELFTGPDASILGNNQYSGIDYGEYVEAARKAYVRATSEDSRAALMPFFWNELSRNGVVLGNRLKGSTAHVKNDQWFSAPGYIEILTGEPHADVVSNDNIRYPYPSFMEYAKQALGLGFTDMATIGSWEGFGTLSSSREGFFFTNAGHEPVPEEFATERMQWLGGIQFDIMTLYPEGRSDAVTFGMAEEYLRKFRPRVLYIAFGESDDWAHQRRYDRYLDYIHTLDGYLRRLWGLLQSMDQYHDRTTLIITTDHGRGALADWVEHDAKIEGSQYIWIAVVGPDTPDLEEVGPYQTVTQSDLAATALTLLGLDWRKFNPNAGPPIPAAIGGTNQ